VPTRSNNHCVFSAWIDSFRMFHPVDNPIRIARMPAKVSPTWSRIISFKNTFSPNSFIRFESVKSRILKWLALSFLVVLASPAAEFSNESKGDEAHVETEGERGPVDHQVEVRRMEDQKCEILVRVGMAAPLDAAETTDPSTGVDSVQEIYDSGFIIAVTLEEVEAALHAAAQTPETEDDTNALILMHRGSYRFFINE